MIREGEEGSAFIGNNKGELFGQVREDCSEAVSRRRRSSVTAQGSFQEKQHVTNQPGVEEPSFL